MKGIKNIKKPITIKKDENKEDSQKNKEIKESKCVIF
jgi:hypothetical protein